MYKTETRIIIEAFESEKAETDNEFQKVAQLGIGMLEENSSGDLH